MFAEERQEKLLGILREKRKVAVSEMCDVFNVSGATIRADLRQLEEEGLLTRTHAAACVQPLSWPIGCTSLRCSSAGSRCARLKV